MDQPAGSSRSQTAARPGRLRAVAGFLLAPLVPSVAIGWWDGGSVMSVEETASAAALFWAYPAALVLGVPAYLVLRKRMQPTAPTVAVVGGLVAALPMLAIFWMERGFALRPFAELFALGAIGGLVFWIVVFWRAGGADARTRPEPAPTRVERG